MEQDKITKEDGKVITVIVFSYIYTDYIYSLPKKINVTIKRGNVKFRKTVLKFNMFKDSPLLLHVHTSLELSYGNVTPMLIEQ